MRKSRISFSINKKSSNAEGGAEPARQQLDIAPTSQQQPTMTPSSYLACRFCCKRFKSEKTYENHSKTKSHARAVKSGSESELTKSRTCAGCQQTFENRQQLVDHCRRFSHMPLVQTTDLKSPVYGKAYTPDEQEDPFVSIKYYSPYYCEVCDLDCVSDVHYQDHVKGARHQKAMEKRAEQGSGVLVNLDTQEVDTTEKCLVIMNKVEPVTETVSAYYCGICDTDCRSELGYTEHVTGKEHQVRMEGHGQMKISCELCCMTFTNLNNHKMHLKSKKHANNVAAKERLMQVAEGEAAGESVQDLRDKIKRTLSPPLQENFDRIKVNVATAETNEASQRSVVIDQEGIEAEEAPFMEMGRPKAGGGRRKSESGRWDKKAPELDKKLKEDAEERGKWAKKREEEYAKRKADVEKTKVVEKDRPKRDTSTGGYGFPRGRGGRGRGRGRGRGGGRFSKDDKFTWTRPGFDAEKSGSGKGDSYRQRYSKGEKKGDREDSGGKRDSKSERREKRRGYEDARERKKYESDSEDEGRIVKKGKRKGSRSPSTDDNEGDDLRNVINKQRGKAKRSNEGAAELSTDDYQMTGGEAGDDDGKNALVFDYGHQHVQENQEEKPRGLGNRAELKGFFGGVLSSLADHFQRPGFEGEESGVGETERYRDEQRQAGESPQSQYASRAEPTFEKVPAQAQQEKEDVTQNTEKQLLLELLKRQFPDIRYLTEQQGGLELMQRIFGEAARARSIGGDSFGGGIGIGESGVGGIGIGDSGIGTGGSFGGGGSIGGGGGSVGSGGGRAGSDDGSFGRERRGSDGGGRKVFSAAGNRDEVDTERGFQRRSLADDGDLQNFSKDRRVVSSTPFRKDEGKAFSGVGERTLEDDARSKLEAKDVTSFPEEKEKSSAKMASGVQSEEKSRGVGKKEMEKNAPKEKVDARKERKRSRSRSRDRRRPSRSRSSSRGRSRNKGSKYSSRKRSRSHSEERSSSKKSKRSPSPAKNSKKDDAKSSKKDDAKSSKKDDAKSSKKDDAKSSTRRKRSVSPKRGEKEKSKKKGDAKSTEESDEKKDESDGQPSLVSQMREKSKDAKGKALAKWTVQNWSGKGERNKSAGGDVDESGRKKTEEKDKKAQKVASKRSERKDKGEATDGEQSTRRKPNDRDERKVSNKEESSSSRSKKAARQEDEGKRDESSRKRNDSEGEKIFEDASDYEEIDLDDVGESRNLKHQFEDDYDMGEPQLERRRDVTDERNVTVSRYSQPRTFTAKTTHAEAARGVEKTVPRVEDVRQRISENLESAEDDAEFDPYSYEDRAFEAQVDTLEGQRELHLDLIAHLARSGIPYPNLGYERFGQEQTFPQAGDYLSALGLARGFTQGTGLTPVGGLTPGHGLAQGRGSAQESNVARGTVGTVGSSVRGRGISAGQRNNSALMYIQPTEDDDQLRATSSERSTTSHSGSRLATSQGSNARGSSAKTIPTTASSVLRTISPAPDLARTTAGKQERVSLGSSHSSRAEQATKMDASPARSEEEQPELSDSELSDFGSSKPLKSILKKKSKFTPVEAASPFADTEVRSSGNLPKNVVGAEYVVQNSGDQGKFFCQLCNVQFTTLSAKNLHLRGPKHLAMFMKHKSPLIDQMIRQAMGGEGKPEEDTTHAQTKVSGSQRQLSPVDENLGRDWREMRTQAPHQAGTKAEPLDPSPRASSGRADVPLRDPTKNVPREAEVPELSYSSNHAIGDEPLLHVDEKTGRFVQSQGYYSERVSRKSEGTAEDYGRTRARDERPNQSPPPVRGRNDRAQDERFVTRKEYSQVPSREEIPLSRDEYDRLLTERDLAEPRDDYNQPLRGEGGHPAIYEYGQYPAKDHRSPRENYDRLPPREARPTTEDYGRFPHGEGTTAPAREDYYRLPPREVPPSTSEDIGRPPSRESYGRPSLRESYSRERDWQSGEPDREPPLQYDRLVDPSRQDWSPGGVRSHDQQRSHGDKMAQSGERESREVPTSTRSQYMAPEKDKSSPSRDVPANKATTTDPPKDLAEGPRDGGNRQPERGTAEPTMVPKAENKSETTEAVGKQRETPDRYESRPSTNRREASGNTYGQQSYHEQLGGSRQPAKSTSQSPMLPKAENKNDSSEVDGKRRDNPDRYESRSSSDRREMPGNNYGQQSYREQYDRSYGVEERYGGRDTHYDKPMPSRTSRPDQSGYGYNDPPRRGGGGSRGNRGSRGNSGTRGNRGRGMGGRGGPRGYPRKSDFTKPARQSWKGGQGRY